MLLHIAPSDNFLICNRLAFAVITKVQSELAYVKKDKMLP